MALFIWGATEHMATPLGMMGIKMSPNDAALVPAIEQMASGPGLYFFPGADMSKKMTKEEEAAWNAKYKAGPHGILILGPNGVDPGSPRKIATELFANILTAFVTALLLARFAGGLGSFVSGGIIAFLIGWMSISVPSWNWYDFPASFVLAELIDQVVSGAVVGLVVGLFLKRTPA